MSPARTRSRAWYVARGYEIVDRNWRVREGEIDVIARDAGSVVFCEVKTRRGDAFGAPVEAVTARKQQRLRLLARLWLADRRRRVPALRFDVASVMPGRPGRLDRRRARGRVLTGLG